MKALFELFRRFDARRIFGFIRRLGGMSCPKVKCYDLRSTHALRVEGDATSPTHINAMDIFLSTPSGWKATYFRIRSRSSTEFLSTPSGWRATITMVLRSGAMVIFLPTPSGWRATRRGRGEREQTRISIHALRVEGDSNNRFSLSRVEISIHALRVEGDL